MKGWEQGQSRSDRNRILLYALLAMAVLAALGCAVYFIGAALDGEQPRQQEVYGSLEGRFKPDMTLVVDQKEYAYFDNYFTNILIVGVDKDDIAAQTVYRAGGQADFLMLLSINRHNRSITPIHIDRDTVTDVKVYSPFGRSAGVNRMQICLSHAFSSSNEQNSSNTIWAVERLMQGIEVDQYLMMDMTGIAMLNDALGGVTVTLEDDFSHLDPAMIRGAQITLKGKQAEYFVRSRQEVGDQSNRQRMDRQRAFLNGLSDLFRQKVQQNPDFVLNLFSDLSGHLYTSLDAEWINSQTYALEHYEQKPIVDLKGTHAIGPDGYMEFRLDEAELKNLIRDVFLVSMEGGGIL